MRTIDKIKEQIHNRQIEFYGSEVVRNAYLNKWNIRNINHLTCLIIENYLYEKTSDFYDVSVESIYFKSTNSKYMDFYKLIETNEEMTSFWCSLDAIDYSVAIRIDVNIPTYDETESYKDYIKKVFKTISKEIRKAVKSFDPEEHFDEIYIPYKGDSPKNLFEDLNNAKDTFYEFLDELD